MNDKNKPWSGGRWFVESVGRCSRLACFNKIRYNFWLYTLVLLLGFLLITVVSLRVQIVGLQRTLQQVDEKVQKVHEVRSVDPCEIMEKVTPLVPASRLPRIIHQTWPRGKTMPPHTKDWFDKWGQLFPNVEHRLWSDEDLEQLVEHEFPFFLPTFRAYPINIMRVDAARTFILYKYGGLYADMDYQPFVNFWNRLPDDAPALIESYWPYEDYQNSFMSSPPGHPFWNYTWTLMAQRLAEKPNAIFSDTLYLTGPALIDASVKLYNSDHPDQRIRTLPCHNWQRFAMDYQANPKDRAQNYYNGYFKKCGNLLDPRCQLGTHHSTTTWTPPLKTQ